MRNGRFPTEAVNKEHPGQHRSQRSSENPGARETQEGERPPSSRLPRQALPRRALSSSGCGDRTLASDELSCTSREWAHWAQTPASYQTHKSAKFLSLRYLVFRNEQWSFGVQTACPFLQGFCITRLLCSQPQSSLRVTWGAAAPTRPG